MLGLSRQRLKSRFRVVASFYYSLNVFTTFGQPLRWAGLSNYVKLAQDDLFWVSLYNTLYMVVFGVSFHIVLAIILGLLLIRICVEHILSHDCTDCSHLRHDGWLTMKPLVIFLAGLQDIPQHSMMPQ